MAVTFRTYRDAHVALRIPGCATALRRRILLLPRITYHYRLTNYQNTAVSARLVIAIQSYHLTKPPSLLQRVTPHHLRLGGTHDIPWIGREALRTPKDWYWTCKLAYFF